ncbi:MAG: hypothetical protein JWO33_2941 [Caulobacteraceae bacterium]|nr:hypothetical protein [Caulobacteraceae bacterium]
MTAAVHRLHSGDGPPDEEATRPPFGGFPVEADELPFKVEIWDESGQFVELVVAVSSSPAIGYAAYYAATREFAGRAITLRHKNRVLSRWAGRTH